MPGNQNVNQRLTGNAVTVQEAGGGMCVCVQHPWGVLGKGVWCSPPHRSPKPLAPVNHKFLTLKLAFDSTGEVQMTCFHLLFIKIISIYINYIALCKAAQRESVFQSIVCCYKLKGTL